MYENSLVNNHKITLNPRALGTITRIADKGSYSVDDIVLETEFDGKTTQHSLMQIWPVRAPRPVADKLTADYPLLTGQRVLDALFPYVISPCGSQFCSLHPPVAFKVERLQFLEHSVPARLSSLKLSPSFRIAISLFMLVAENEAMRWLKVSESECGLGTPRD